MAFIVLIIIGMVSFMKFRCKKKAQKIELDESMVLKKLREEAK